MVPGAHPFLDSAFMKRKKEDNQRFEPDSAYLYHPAFSILRNSHGRPVCIILDKGRQCSCQTVRNESLPETKEGREHII